MEALYRAALAALESLPAVRAMPDKPAGRLRSPEITVSLERCTLEGLPRYLGLLEVDGEQKELFAHRAKAKAAARCHAGTAQAAEELAARTAQAWLQGMEGVTVRSVQTGTVCYDPRLDCFACPVEATAEAWIYAVPSGEELYFDDFVLRGTLLSRQQGQEGFLGRHRVSRAVLRKTAVCSKTPYDQGLFLANLKERRWAHGHAARSRP